jgi:hypothetical protein
MHIIAIGWIYVVLMMAITEKSVIAGIMTFTLYCAIPLGVVWIILRLKKRRTTNSHNNQNQVDAANDPANTKRDDRLNSNDNLESQK